jgi:CYTH domain-containing protein
VPIGTRTFEVDVYEGPLQGLATAEVEFSESENPMDLTLPDWVGRDVSEEIEYSNAWLAEFGSCH